MMWERMIEWRLRDCRGQFNTAFRKTAICWLVQNQRSTWDLFRKDSESLIKADNWYLYRFRERSQYLIYLVLLKETFKQSGNLKYYRVIDSKLVGDDEQGGMIWASMSGGKYWRGNSISVNSKNNRGKPKHS